MGIGDITTYIMVCFPVKLAEDYPKGNCLLFFEDSRRVLIDRPVCGWVTFQCSTQRMEAFMMY